MSFKRSLSVQKISVDNNFFKKEGTAALVD